MRRPAVVDGMTSDHAHHLLNVLKDLERGGAISASQANAVREAWPMEDGWAASPYLRVAEHTRAFIDGLRKGAPHA